MSVTLHRAMNFLGTGWNAVERIFDGISNGSWSSTRFGSAFADAPSMVQFPALPPRDLGKDEVPLLCGERDTPVTRRLWWWRVAAATAALVPDGRC
jgi:hypothetical protein